MLYLPTELAPSAEEALEYGCTFASSVPPRHRLEFHRVRLRKVQAQFLKLQTELNETIAQIHNHIACIDAVLRSHVCLTREEHIFLTEGAILHNERGERNAGAAGVTGDRGRGYSRSDSSE